MGECMEICRLPIKSGGLACSVIEGEKGGGKIPRARNVHSDKHGPELDKNLCEDICEWQGIMKTIAVTRFMSLTNVR